MSEYVDSPALNETALFAKPADDIRRIGAKVLPITVVGAAATVAGYFLDHGSFWTSYLIGYVFWLLLSIGSMALLMLQYLTGGTWGLIGRRVMEASAKNLLLLAVLFLPIAFNLSTLYPWARPEAASDPLIQVKAGYLNPTFFLARIAGYFAIWGFLTWRLTSWGAQQDEAPARIPGPEDRKFRVLSGPGTVLFVLTITFMSVDLVMSLDPHWSSTIFGVIFLGGSGLGTLAFLVMMLAALSRFEPMKSVIRTETFHDYGKLMYAFVLLWAYFVVSQLIIVWSGNLPEEIPFYIVRFKGPWVAVSYAILFGHFVLPFSFLLSRRLKRNPSAASMVALFILVMRAVDVAWTVGPMARPTGTGGLHWLDGAAVLGLGAPWLFFFFRNLAGRPLLPARDPYFKDVLAHDGH